MIKSGTDTVTLCNTLSFLLRLYQKSTFLFIQFKISIIYVKHGHCTCKCLVCIATTGKITILLVTVMTSIASTFGANLGYFWHSRFLYDTGKCCVVQLWSRCQFLAWAWEMASVAWGRSMWSWPGHRLQPFLCGPLIWLSFDFHTHKQPAP